MTAGEKAKAKTEQAKGKLKETLGDALGNDRMAVEGQAEKSKGDAREAKEKTKDAFRP
ncbi:CsbD family protein [Streptomyces sp. NPDC052040]|uniref:CsbD family protein n=1 Tax=unclassified Streptomyces TaxID=2593676 RepID=UPI0037D5FF39